MKKKNRIRLTESQLHSIIRESVKQVISELSSHTVRATMNKMKAMGAKDRAKHIGDLAVNNYGGKELQQNGFTTDGDTLGRITPDKVRNRVGWERDDEKYLNDVTDYGKKSALGRIFSKKPQMPQDYGKSDYRNSGSKSFSESDPKTDDNRIARQAANFYRWCHDGDDRDFIKKRSSYFRR